MQCFVCGEQMRRFTAEPDAAVDVAGFETRTFQCAACGDIEKRMAFAAPRPSWAQAAQIPQSACKPPFILSRFAGPRTHSAAW